jgi:phage replication O-like protein O
VNDLASPQKENGYTSIANELLEQIYRRRFSASQLKILLLVIRFTYGFNRRTATLSNTFIAAGTGMHEITVSKEVGTLLRDNVLKLYKKPSFHNSRVIGINKDYEGWRNHLELAEALRVSENFDRVSEMGEIELADTLTKKENLTKTTVKKEKDGALTGDDCNEFLVHPNSGELYKIVDGIMYNKRGKRLNEAGYVDIDFGLSKGGNW